MYFKIKSREEGSTELKRPQRLKTGSEKEYDPCMELKQTS